MQKFSFFFRIDNVKLRNFPAGIWCQNDVLSMLMRRDVTRISRRIDINTTSFLRHVPAGFFSFQVIVHISMLTKEGNCCNFLLASADDVACPNWVLH